jgi:hypothetical protein
MDSIDSIRRVRSYITMKSSDSEASQREADDRGQDEIARVYRHLRLVRVIIVIVATLLTIARMLGWL